MLYRILSCLEIFCIISVAQFFITAPDFSFLDEGHKGPDVYESLADGSPNPFWGLGRFADNEKAMPVESGHGFGN